MRIGLYGMPCAGKSCLLRQVDFLEAIEGSRLLREVAPDFDKRDERGRRAARVEANRLCKRKDGFAMSAHYSFGAEVAFTEEEGEMYDRFLYLYIAPKTLEERMRASEKNSKYLAHGVAAWQEKEINSLRDYCHKRGKDFYVIDEPPSFERAPKEALAFLRDIAGGYSCAAFARRIAARILAEASSDTVTLLDGDRTLIVEDSSSVAFNYKTRVFDGNFYTGFQVWRQYREFEALKAASPDAVNVRRNPKMPKSFEGDAFILSCGHEGVWQKIAAQFGIPCFAGEEMSAEAKLFVARRLKEAGKRVIAYGDSMSDYFMLKEADAAYLVAREGGEVSRSLKNRDLRGFNRV